MRRKWETIIKKLGPARNSRTFPSHSKIKVMKTIRAQDYIKMTELATKEKNACTVYAFAAAFNVDFDQAHGTVEYLFERESKKGAKTSNIVNRMKQAFESQEVIRGHRVTSIMSNPKKLTRWKYGGNHQARRTRISTFIQDYPIGTFYILVRNHAVVIKDGVLIDNLSKASAKSIVKHAFQIEPA